MKIDSGRLPEHLKAGLKPLYVLHGDAPLILVESADAIRSVARSEGFLEREILTVEQGFDWGSLQDASRSLSLFCAKKLVDLRIPSGKIGTEGGQALQAYCESLQPDVLTLITLPKLDRQTLSSKWFEALEKTGATVSANTVDRAALPEWISGRLARQNQRADGETLQFIADSVEGNLLAAHQEIQKIGLLYPEGKISFDDAKNAVLDVARYDIFQLGEAMLGFDSVRFAKILEGLRGEGVAETLVLWQLTDEIRAMIRVKAGMKAGRPQAQVLREARLWGARQSLVLRACRRAGVRILEEMLVRAAHIDQMIKGLRKGNVWDELLQLGVNFAAQPKNG
jgi:DNA polymerase-3 subunit delta